MYPDIPQISKISNTLIKVPHSKQYIVSFQSDYNRRFIDTPTAGLEPAVT